MCVALTHITPKSVYLYLHTVVFYVLFIRPRILDMDMLGVQLSLILVALPAFSCNSEIGDSGLAWLQFRCSYIYHKNAR